MRSTCCRSWVDHATKTSCTHCYGSSAAHDVATAATSRRLERHVATPTAEGRGIAGCIWLCLLPQFRCRRWSCRSDGAYVITRLLLTQDRRAYSSKMPSGTLTSAEPPTPSPRNDREPTALLQQAEPDGPERGSRARAEGMPLWGAASRIEPQLEHRLEQHAATPFKRTGASVDVQPAENGPRLPAPSAACSRLEPRRAVADDADASTAARRRPRPCSRRVCAV